MKKITTITFTVILIMFGTATIAACFSEEAISEQESRALAERPVFSLESYLSGAYYRAFDDYLADHVPYRLFFIGLADGLKGLWELTREASLIDVPADIGVAPVQNGEEGRPANEIGSVPQGETQPRQSLIASRDRYLEVYVDDEKTRARYAEAVNRCARNAPAGVRVYSMLIPMRIEFEEEAYRREADSQKDAVSAVYAAYDERVEKVDAYAMLERHKSEYIYFRTDHHWTALGAYFGLLAFAETAGFEPVDITAYKETAMPNFLGSLYRLHPNEEAAKHPDTLSYYLKNGKNNSTVAYYYDESGTLQSFKNRIIDRSFVSDAPTGIGVFIGGDYPLIRVDGDGPPDRVLAVVKDSYGNAFIPWTTPYFGKIFCVDPRSYKEDFAALTAENGVTDLLILDYTKVLMMPEYADAMNGLFGETAASPYRSGS
jgi:hypothetical protein